MRRTRSPPEGKKNGGRRNASETWLSLSPLNASPPTSRREQSKKFLDNLIVITCTDASNFSRNVCANFKTILLDIESDLLVGLQGFIFIYSLSLSTRYVNFIFLFPFL